MGIPVLVLCIFVLPNLVRLAFDHAVDGKTFGFIVLSILAIIYYYSDSIYYGMVPNDRIIKIY